MSISGSRAWIAVVTTAVVLVVAYLWWTRDERAIRAQMTAIGRALTIAQTEPELERITRVATLRHALAQDIHIPAAALPAAGLAAREQTISRDAVLTLIGRWVPPPGGIVVEFTGMGVTVGDLADAVVRCTLRVTTRQASGEPVVDASDLAVGFAKVDGTWLVTTVQLRPRDSTLHDTPR